MHYAQVQSQHSLHVIFYDVEHIIYGQAGSMQNWDIRLRSCFLIKQLQLFLNIMLGLSKIAKEQKCKEVLSGLLSEQIEKNEELQAQNFMLEEEQRRLLNLLENKIRYIQELEQRGEKQQHFSNDSTLEMTALSTTINAQLTNKQVKENAILSKRIEGLQKTIKEKESQMVKLRNYYTNIIDKMQDENSPKSFNNQELTKKMNEQMVKMKNENDNLHEIILKNSQKIRQLSQELIVMEQSHQQLEAMKLQLIEKEHQDLIRSTQQEVETFKREYDEKMVENMAQLENRQRRKQEESEEKLGKQRKEYEQKIRKIKKENQGKMQQLKQEYDNRISFMIVRSQEQKKELKEKYLQEAKTIIVAQLEKQEEQNHSHLQQIKNTLKQTQDKLKVLQSKCQEQVTMMNYLQDDLKATKKSEGQLEIESKRHKMMLQERNMLITKLQQLHTTEKENVIYLQEEKGTLADQVKEKDQKILKLSSQSKKNQLNIKKLTTEVNQITNKYQTLSEEYKIASQQLQLKKHENERLTVKISKDNERKEKNLSQTKRMFQENENEINRLKQRLQKYELKEDEKLKDYEFKLKESKQQMMKISEEKNKVMKENKKIKDEVFKLQEKVKYSILQFQKKIQDLMNQRSELLQNNKKMHGQRQNYRRLYQTNAQQNQRLKQILLKKQDENEKYERQIANCRQEIQMYKQEMASYQLQSNEKQELYKYRAQNLELKAKVSNYHEVNVKLKKQNGELARDIINMNNDREGLEEISKKSQNKINLMKNEKNLLIKEVQGLKSELQRRCIQIEKGMPYINTLIEQKKNLQSELAKLTNQMKRKDHLLQMAKRSKAEQFMKLKHECQQLRKKDHKMQKQIQEQNVRLQQMNRQKVNIYRETTSKEELIRKLQKDVKHLKIELKKSQNTCDQQLTQIQKLYQIIEAAQMPSDYQ